MFEISYAGVFRLAESKSEVKIPQFKMTRSILRLKLRPIFYYPHIAQNISETYQKYFQSFIANEKLSQHFYQIFKNRSFTNLTFWNISENK